MGTVYTCIGMRRVDFRGSDGGQVDGFSLYLTYEDEKIDGVGCEKVFIPTKRFMELSFIPKVGSCCELFYNKYGKVSDIGAA